MHLFCRNRCDGVLLVGKKPARYARNLAFARYRSRQEIISNKRDHRRSERMKKRHTSSLVPLKTRAILGYICGNVFMCSTIVMCTYKLSSLFIENDLWRVRRRGYSITHPRSYAFSKNRFGTRTRIAVVRSLPTNTDIWKTKNCYKTCILV